jgi:iron-sulfur cluster repair protein YtfE (RIC family)
MTGAGPETTFDESTRPQAPPPLPDQADAARAPEVGQHLVEVHDHLRAELRRLHGVLDQVRVGAVSSADARGALNEMTMRQHNWALGAYCAQYCTLLTGHHSLEDQAVFPHLRSSQATLAPVIDRLEEEHLVIHEIVLALDRALVDHLNAGTTFEPLQAALDRLSDALLSHLSYEEQQLVEPLGRFGFYPGQV